MAKKRGRQRAASTHPIASDGGNDDPDARVPEEPQEFVVLTFAVPSPAIPATFSAAEGEVALAVLDGHTNAEIAAARKTSVRTVANQVVAMYRKLGVHSRSELVVALTTGQKAPTLRGRR